MLGERIKSARIDKGLSQQEVANRMGLSKAAVSKWEKGDFEPKNMDVLAKILDVNIRWLREGKGERFAARDGAPLNELDMQGVEEWDSNTVLQDDEVEVPYYKSIELAAGHGMTQQDDYNGFKLRFSKSFFRRKGVQKEFVACFPAKGNSMEPVIPNGSTLAVDTATKDIVDGDVYMICQDDLCRVKRLYNLPGKKVRINSYNTNEYQDEIVPLNEVEIVGRVFHYSVEL